MKSWIKLIIFVTFILVGYIGVTYVFNQDSQLDLTQNIGGQEIDVNIPDGLGTIYNIVSSPNLILTFIGSIILFTSGIWFSARTIFSWGRK